MIYFQGSRGTVVHLFADAKADVVEGATIIGMPETVTIGAGSDIYTGDFHIGIRLSDGSWSWDDDEEASKALTMSKPSTLKQSIQEDPFEEPELFEE